VLIAGVVVLYNPDPIVIQNIQSYLPFLYVLYVIDNSESPNMNIVEQLRELGEKIKYIALGENRGVAYALNLGATLAIESGADWLLTMDQDSSFEGDSASKLVEYCESLEDERVAIVTALHVDSDIVVYKKEKNCFHILP